MTKQSVGQLTSRLVCLYRWQCYTIGFPRAEMTTDQDLPMDHQSALFAAKGIDVTTNKDQGVIKVFIILSSCDC